MVATLLILTLLPGQANTPADAALDKEQQRKWNDYYAKTAASYEIARAKDSSQNLELKPEAVLHWSNPVRGGETNGSVFVWTYEGGRSWSARSSRTSCAAIRPKSTSRIPFSRSRTSR